MKVSELLDRQLDDLSKAGSLTVHSKQVSEKAGSQRNPFLIQEQVEYT